MLSTRGLDGAGEGGGTSMSSNKGFSTTCSMKGLFAVRSGRQPLVEHESICTCEVNPTQRRIRAEARKYQQNYTKMPLPLPLHHHTTSAVQTKSKVTHLMDDFQYPAG